MFELRDPSGRSKGRDTNRPDQCRRLDNDILSTIFVDRAVVCRLNVISEVLFENHMYVKKFPQ